MTRDHLGELQPQLHLPRQFTKVQGSWFPLNIEGIIRVINENVGTIATEETYMHHLISTSIVVGPIDTQKVQRRSFMIEMGIAFT